MGSRRTFLKKLGTLGLGISALGSSSFAQGNKLNPDEIPAFDNSETYWKLIQQQFTLKNGLTYLNNGTIGPSPLIVQNALIDSIRQIDQDGRYVGYNIAREGIAQLIGAKSTEIALTNNTTQGINILAWGLPLKKNDKVILTQHEHVGNIMPWLNRAKADGIKPVFFQPATTAAEVLSQIEGLIDKKTRVVSVPHISCTIGQQFPIAKIQKLCRENNIWLVVDGAHGAGALDLDMQALDIDYYASCGHKWMLGPKGTGFVYVKEELLDTITPVFAGAYTDAGFDIINKPPKINGYNPTAHRYDYGTKNTSIYIGLNKATEFHLKIGTTNIQKRILGLNAYLRSKLLELNTIELIGSEEAESHSMMLGFKHKKIDYKELYNILGKASFRVRQVPEANVNCIRISTHIYNNKEQIDRMCAKLTEI